KEACKSDVVCPQHSPAGVRSGLELLRHPLVAGDEGRHAPMPFRPLRRLLEQSNLVALRVVQVGDPTVGPVRGRSEELRPLPTEVLIRFREIIDGEDNEPLRGLAYSLDRVPMDGEPHAPSIEMD